MPSVLVTMPKSEALVKKYGVKWPEGWEVRYVDINDLYDVIDENKDVDYFCPGAADPVSEDLVRAFDHLKMIHVIGVSFNRIPLDVAKELGIPVCNCRAVNAVGVAEHTICLMLAGIKKLAWLDKSIRANGYAPTDKEFLKVGVTELEGKTVGMIGMGAIGKGVAARLAGWNCRLVYSDPIRVPEDLEKALGLEYLTQEELLKQADIVSIHLPVLPSTINMINKETLSTMKPNALLVNVARGEIVNNEDIVWALENGIIGGAAFDTIAPEPMPDDHPFLHMSEEAMKKITFTTHIAGRTNESFQRMFEWTARDIYNYENGEPAFNCVNGL